jgi:uncharacterized protein involved in type VI secretion and phage assembly
MTDDLLNLMRLHARIAMSNIALTRMGTIASFDNTTWMATVIIEPQDLDNPSASLSSPIPVLSQMVGDQWGIFTPPAIGSACMVHFSEGSPNAACVSLFAFNQSFRPLPVPAGEMWLVHQSGSYIKLTNDGSVTISGNAANLGLISAGNLQNLLLKSASDVFNTHTHASNGAPPTQQMTSADWTQYTEAN